MAQRSVECHLPFVTLADPDEMISVTEIQFGEDGGVVEGFECRIDEREGS